MPHKVESRLLFATKFWYIYCITTTTPTCHATKLEENASDWFFQVPIMLPCKELIHARPTVATCFWDSSILASIFAVLGQFFPRIPKAIKLWLQLSGFFFNASSRQQTSFLFLPFALQYSRLHLIDQSEERIKEHDREHNIYATTNFVTWRVGQVRGIYYVQQHAPTCNAIMLRCN